MTMFLKAGLLYFQMIPNYDLIIVTSAIRRRIRAGLKVVTIEIIEIVTTITVTTFKRCNNLNML